MAGVTQEKGHRWHMAGDRVGVPRRQQMAPSQEWGWGEEEGGGWVSRTRNMSGMWLHDQENGYRWHLAGTGEGWEGRGCLMPSQRRDMVDTSWIWGQAWCRPRTETWVVPQQM